MVYSVVKQLQRKQLHIVLLCGVLGILLAVMYGITMYPQPLRVDAVLPAVRRFNGFDWYKSVPFAAMPVILLVVLCCMIFLYVRWLKILSILLLLAVSLWLVAIGIIDIVNMSNPNHPETPNNPANSYAACCTPQFFTTVTTCANFGLGSPQCTPPRTLADIGVNGDTIFVFIWECLFLIGALLGIVYILQLMQLITAFQANGDNNFVQQTLAETGDPYYSAKGVNPTSPYYGKATPLVQGQQLPPPSSSVQQPLLLPAIRR